MTNWWWVRHGPTHAKGMVGWTDLPADLSDTHALQRLDRHLPSDAVVVSSDLLRSAATADAIAHARLRLPHSPQLREINFGDWDNRSFAEVEQADADLARRYWSEPGEVAPPNGESWNQTKARVDAEVDRLTREHSGKHIIAVAHFGVILTQLQRAARLKATSAIAFKIDNLSVTRLENTGGHWRVLGVNHTP